MKVVVIGVGVMGKNHARVLSDLGHLAGVVDMDENAAKIVATRYGVEWGRSFENLEFDAAVVATPTITHYELAKKLIEEGKHVLVEKPFVHNVSEGEELIDLARNNNVTLAVGHIERHNPMVEFVKKNVVERDGIISIGAKRVSRFPSRIRDVGVVMDLGVHDIDVLRYLMGDIVEVYARGGKIKHDKYEDHASILLGFRNGKSGYIETNWLTPKKIRKLWITTETSYVEGDYISQSVEISSEKLSVDEFNTYNLGIDLNIRRINLKKEEPLKREITDFIDAISKNVPPLVSGEDGLAAVKIAKAALESMERGKVVEVE
ncbi:putative dehydrogenase [Aciduliprofundum sp. MAR08-339]|uniref:Gfo/Idh/MocA family protein n=1 Tax=Aciduliprofundum sp. (strain MAR08-339) TaxID=673860 RepID=UPI0002A49E0F|nr:putative dehydrogenase [Aciduliprofundum sp. MAR08-339]